MFFIEYPIKDNNQLQKKLNDLRKEVHFEYQKENIHFENHIAICSWAKRSYFYSEDDFYFMNESGEVTILQGYCWDLMDVESGALNAERISHLVKSKGNDIELVRDQLIGEYSIMTINTKEREIIAFNDKLGIENIYYSNFSNRLVITNRMNLFHQANQFYNYDLSGMIWLPILGYRFAEETSHHDLRKLEQGAYLKFNDELEVFEDPHFFMKSAKDTSGLDKNQLQKGIDQSIDYINALFAGKDNVKLGITGGMDSRLVLALALSSKIKDRITLFTNGDPEHPDVIVGKMIANAVDLPFENNIPRANNAKGSDSEQIIEKLKHHVFLNEGMFGAWDLKSYTHTANVMTLAGFAGELLKGYSKSKYHFKTVPDPDSFIPMQGILDPLGLLKEGVRNEVINKLKDRINFYLDSGASYNDIPDIFYLKERIPNWLGAARRVDFYMNQVVSPLNAIELIRFSFSLTNQQRQINLIHYLILKKLRPTLLSIPFAGQKWSKELEKYDADKEIFQEPVMPKGNQKMHGSWQYLLNEDITFRVNIIKIIESFKEEKIWQYLDKDKFLNILKSKVLAMKELISVFGLFTVLFEINGFKNNKRMKLPSGLSSSISDYPPTDNLTSNLDFDSKVLCEGYIDDYNSGYLIGWVWSPILPDFPLTIEVFSSENELYSLQTADLKRLDLKAAEKGNGVHGFRIELAEKYISQVSIRVKGTDFYLKDSTRFKNLRNK